MPVCAVVARPVINAAYVSYAQDGGTAKSLIMTKPYPAGPRTGNGTAIQEISDEEETYTLVDDCA